MLHRAPKVVLISDPRVSDVRAQDCREDLVDTCGAITGWFKDGAHVLEEDPESMQQGRRGGNWRVGVDL
jgi:hypothetical protein